MGGYVGRKGRQVDNAANDSVRPTKLEVNPVPEA